MLLVIIPNDLSGVGLQARISVFTALNSFQSFDREIRVIV